MSRVVLTCTVLLFQIITVDPTQFENGMKNLDKERDDTVVAKYKVSQLTWALEENKNENHKRRMGEFPDYTPPKRQKPSYSFSRKSGRGSVGDDDFEVVGLDASPSIGQGSRSFNAYRYNSDSSDDESAGQTSRGKVTKAPLPDIVKLTRLGTEALKRFNSSASESDHDESSRKTRVTPSTKTSKSPSMKIGFSSAVATNNKTELRKSSNKSDSGSESDTPMASLKNKRQSDILQSPMVQSHKRNEETDVLSFANKKPNGDRQTKSRFDKKSARRTDNKNSNAGRLPEFRGIGMLDADSKIYVKKKKPKRKFDDVVYGADILAELFSSDDSFDDSSEESSDGNVQPIGNKIDKKGNKSKGSESNSIQGAIDNLLGLSKGMEFGSVPSSKGIGNTKASDRGESESSDDNVESDEETSDGGDSIEAKVEEQTKPKEVDDGNDADSSDVESMSNDQISHDDDEFTTVKKVYYSDSSDGDVPNKDAKDNLQAIKDQALGDKIKSISRKSGSLLNTSAHDEFSSGLVGLEGEMSSGNKDNTQSDSDEDLLDLVSSGKVKKVKEYERQALSEIPSKQSKNAKTNKTKESKNAKTNKTKESKSIEKSPPPGKKKSKDDKGDTRNRETKSVDTKVKKTKSTTKLDKSENKPKTKQQKHAADNERRVESLRQKEQQMKSQRATIKSALASIVSMHSNLLMKLRFCGLLELTLAIVVVLELNYVYHWL